MAPPRARDSGVVSLIRARQAQGFAPGSSAFRRGDRDRPSSSGGRVRKGRRGAAQMALQAAFFHLRSGPRGDGRRGAGGLVCGASAFGSSRPGRACSLALILVACCHAGSDLRMCQLVVSGAGEGSDEGQERELERGIPTASPRAVGDVASAFSSCLAAESAPDVVVVVTEAPRPSTLFRLVREARRSEPLDG